MVKLILASAFFLAGLGLTPQAQAKIQVIKPKFYKVYLYDDKNFIVKKGSKKYKFSRKTYKIKKPQPDLEIPLTDLDFKKNGKLIKEKSKKSKK